MSDLLEIVVLGIVQGLSEFLPISSDGHLVIVAALFEHFTGRHRPDVLERSVALHAGTLLAVLTVFGRDLIQALLHDRRVLALLVVGTLPAVAVGLAGDRYFKHWLESPLLAGAGLIVTGIVLLWGTRGKRGEATYPTLPYDQALSIGVFQAAAILPGVSRSGLTIASGMRAGLTGRDAATYSFLLSIPAVAGACLLEGLKIARSTTPGSTPLAELAIGAAAAFVVGLAALLWLLRLLRTGRLHLFAYYTIPLGLVVLAWQLWFQ
ncbi:MAG: undecaprenyl-diphosphate phosphatase [Pirellulales bacterium]|nr:undecaprenyl-diphosphate phosphatase [Pirellulales bacterium]